MTGGETADQAVKMTLQGIEVSANIALKAGGMLAKSLAATLYAIITDKKKVKGKARLTDMLKSGKELKVFAIRGEDLKLFCQEAKKYGVLYSVLKGKNNADGICDIMVRAEDAYKINRIVDKFELATVDTKAIRESVLAEQSLQEPSLQEAPTLNDNEHDDLVSMLMSSVKDEPTIENPSLARTKSQSEHTSKKAKEFGTIEPQKNSVRAELNNIKAERKKKPAQRQVATKQSSPHKKIKRKKKVR